MLLILARLSSPAALQMLEHDVPSLLLALPSLRTGSNVDKLVQLAVLLLPPPKGPPAPPARPPPGWPARRAPGGGFFFQGGRPADFLAGQVCLAAAPVLGWHANPRTHPMSEHNIGRHTHIITGVCVYACALLSDSGASLRCGRAVRAV